VGEQVELMVRSQQAESIAPYERLLSDALSGDPLLFTRQDAVEAAWQVVEPVLNSGQPPHLYEPGTWGPEEADPIIAGSGGWDNPAMIPTI
jgi:glucose-6-phosphate 1-dehydrogenase